MSLMDAIAISASGLTAQRRSLEVHVSNLANANTIQVPGAEPFRPKEVVLSAAPLQNSFGAELENAVQGVEISGIVTDNNALRKEFDPGNPYADEKGFVTYADINPITEMGNVINAARSYEANLQAVTAAKDMAAKTLEILK
jgi:flagellar basal-body rod protein FlgC